MHGGWLPHSEGGGHHRRSAHMIMILSHASLFLAFHICSEANNKLVSQQTSVCEGLVKWADACLQGCMREHYAGWVERLRLVGGS